MYRVIVSICYSVLVWGSVANSAEKIAGMRTNDFITHYDKINQLSSMPVWKPEKASKKFRDMILKKADKITEGYIHFYSKPVFVGAKDIDWFGKQRKHIEWTAQLNRFKSLKILGIAYQLTRDEKYPERAKELINDFRYFLEIKHKNKFLDPQGNNRLNISLRINSWIEALRMMGKSKAFDDEFVQNMCSTLIQQIKGLDKMAVPGPYNIYGAQADTLIMAALRLSSLPEMDKVLKHGVDVFKKSMAMQFRPDGTHNENACGYQEWMTNLVGKYRVLATYDKRVSPGLTDQQLLNSFNFCYLAFCFGSNDHRHYEKFPKFEPAVKRYSALTKRAGFNDWQPVERQSFPDGGMYFAGNKNEHLFFDVSPGSANHQHNARLNFLYAAGGYTIISDHGCRNYERSSPLCRAGIETASHATVHPDSMTQLNWPKSARALRDVNEADYAVFEAEYISKYVDWKNYRKKNPPRLDATHRRRIVWFAGKYILISDYINGPEVTKAKRWNFNFPVPPQDGYKINQNKLEFRTINSKRPNFIIRMVHKPSAKVELIRYYGQKKPVYRGWRGNARNGIPMPLLSFSASQVQPGAVAEILIAARINQKAPAYDVIRSESGALELKAPDGSVDLWLNEKAAAKNGFTFSGERLMIRRDRHGNMIAVFGIGITSYKSKKYKVPFTGVVASE